MDQIICQRTIRQPASEEQVSAEAFKAGTHLGTRLTLLREESKLSWGRSQTSSFSQSLYSAGIMLLCPMLVIFTWITLEYFGGSFLEAFSVAVSLGPFNFTARYILRASLKAYAGYCAWLVLQAVLYTFLPSKLSTGQLTPAGHLLKYYTNGLFAWVVTHLLFATAVILGLLDPAIIAKNWAGLLVAANIYGYFLSAFAYAKAYLIPSHKEDRKFSGKLMGWEDNKFCLTFSRVLSL
jgi:7-dehydrocholesterol reductase